LAGAARGESLARIYLAQIRNREGVKNFHLRTRRRSKLLSYAEDVRLNYDPERPAERFLASLSPSVVRQNEIVSSHEVKSRANLSRPVVVAAQWVNQHEIMLGFEAVQESILT
jgi:hypothetical protein